MRHSYPVKVKNERARFALNLCWHIRAYFRLFFGGKWLSVVAGNGWGFLFIFLIFYFLVGVVVHGAVMVGYAVFAAVFLIVFSGFVSALAIHSYGSVRFGSPPIFWWICFFLFVGGFGRCIQRKRRGLCTNLFRLSIR